MIDIAKVNYLLGAAGMLLLSTMRKGVTATDVQTNHPLPPHTHAYGVLQRHLYTVEDYCENDLRTIRFHEALLIRSQRPHRKLYLGGIQCTMTLNASHKDIGLIIAMKTLVTRSQLDNLTLRLAGSSEPVTLFGNLFDGDSPNHFNVSNNGEVELTWMTANRSSVKNLTATGRGFDMVVTAFKAKCEGNDTLLHGCFKCLTGSRFISAIHVCDNHNNCGDLSDERCSDESVSSLTIVAIVLAVGAVILGLIFATASQLKKCFRRRKILAFDDSLASGVVSYLHVDDCQESTPLTRVDLVPDKERQDDEKLSNKSH